MNMPSNNRFITFLVGVSCLVSALPASSGLAIAAADGTSHAGDSAVQNVSEDAPGVNGMMDDPETVQRRILSELRDRVSIWRATGRPDGGGDAEDGTRREVLFDPHWYGVWSRNEEGRICNTGELVSSTNDPVIICPWTVWRNVLDDPVTCSGEVGANSLEVSCEGDFISTEYPGVRVHQEEEYSGTRDGNTYRITGQISATYGPPMNTTICIEIGANGDRIGEADECPQAPVCDAGGPYQGGAGEEIQFDGSASFDPEGTTITYAWRFGDGLTSDAARPLHFYRDAGAYTVTLTVMDAARRPSTDTTTASIGGANRPPTSVPGGPYAAGVGESIRFDGSGSNDPDGDPLGFVWDFGDGTSAFEAQPLHTYRSGGRYTVTLTVTDPGQLSHSAATLANVNRRPVADAGGPYSASEGAAIRFDGSGSSDPDGDPLVYAWDFGDGSSAGDVQPTRTFFDDDFFTVTLTVTDPSGSSSSSPATVTIDNVAPTCDAGGPYNGQVHLPVRFIGMSEDPGADSLTFNWSFGDGEIAADSVASHVYLEVGFYTVTLTVTDDDDGTTRCSTTADIRDVLPLQVTPTSLSILYDPLDGSSEELLCPEEHVTITNPGEGSVAWTATEMDAWLRLGNVGGSLVGGAVEELEICVARQDVAALGSSPPPGEVRIESDDWSQVIRVLLSVVQYTPGDLNANHELDADDLLRLLTYVLQLDSPALPIRILGLTDVNGDEEENVADLVTLARALSRSLLRHPPGPVQGAPPAALRLFLAPDTAVSGRLELMLSGDGDARVGVVGFRCSPGDNLRIARPPADAPFELFVAQSGGDVVLVFYSLATDAHDLSSGDPLRVAWLERDGDQDAIPTIEWGLVAAVPGRISAIDTPASGAPAWTLPTAPALPILRSIRPNPLADEAEIVYELGERSPVRLSVFTPAGRLVQTLRLGDRKAGVHRDLWRGRDRAGRSLSTGIYFLRLETPGGVSVRRAVIIR